MSSALLPFTYVNRSLQRPSAHCRTTHPVGSHGGGNGWLQEAFSVELMRRAMERYCGLRDRWVQAAPSADESIQSDSTGRLRVVILVRGDSQQHLNPQATKRLANGSQSPDVAPEAAPLHERRQFADLSGLVQTLRAALPHASVRTAMTSANASICAQARWVHGASVVVSPHGAHLTNSLWMSRGALLVEVMPWAMWDYDGYRGLFKASRENAISTSTMCSQSEVAACPSVLLYVRTYCMFASAPSPYLPVKLRANITCGSTPPVLRSASRSGSLFDAPNRSRTAPSPSSTLS